MKRNKQYIDSTATSKSFCYDYTVQFILELLLAGRQELDIDLLAFLQIVYFFRYILVNRYAAGNVILHVHVVSSNHIGDRCARWEIRHDPRGVR